MTVMSSMRMNSCGGSTLEETTAGLAVPFLMTSLDREVHRCRVRVRILGDLVGDTNHQPVTVSPAITVWRNRLVRKIRCVVHTPGNLHEECVGAALLCLVTDCVVPGVWQ